MAECVCRSVCVIAGYSLISLFGCVMYFVGSVEAAGIQKHEPLVTIILDAVMQCVECCIADKPQVKQLWSVVSEPSLLLLQGRWTAASV